MVTTQIDIPTVEAIRGNRAKLGELVVTTPSGCWWTMLSMRWRES